jgi:hypothetical protein
MKTLTLLTLFLITSLFNLLLAADTASGTLTLSGVAGYELSLVFEDYAPATALRLDLPNAAVRIANVHVKSNSSSGYQVLWHSLNAGKMQHTTKAVASVGYTLSGDVGGVQAGTFGLAADQTFYDGNTSPVDYVGGLLFTSSPLMFNNISLGGDASQMLQGTYRDTITATISPQ